MSERISRTQVYKMQPALLQHLVALAKAAEASGLPHSLIHLIKIRASQLNGCAFCQHMHANEARKDGKKNSSGWTYSQPGAKWAQCSRRPNKPLCAGPKH